MTFFYYALGPTAYRKVQLIYVLLQLTASRRPSKTILHRLQSITIRVRGSLGEMQITSGLYVFQCGLHMNKYDFSLRFCWCGL